MSAALTRSQLADLIVSESDSFRVLHRLANVYNTREEHFWQKDEYDGALYFHIYYPGIGIYGSWTVYRQPVYRHPVYRQPVYRQPVYRHDRFIDSQFIDRPFYRQPVYRQSVLSTASLSTARFIDTQFNNDISI